jgi:hypothetical protein
MFGCDDQPQLSGDFRQAPDSCCQRPLARQPHRRPHRLHQGFVLPTLIPQQTTVKLAIGSALSQVYSATLDRTVAFDSGTLTDFARYVGGVCGS